MNEHTIVGNLTRDPEVHVSAKNARTVTTFDVAVNRRRFDREIGEWIEQTPVFHRVVTYGQLADHAAESLRRGVEVAVIGRIADDSYTAEDNTRRVRTVLEAEVVAPSLRWAIARPMKVSRSTAPAEDTEEVGA